MALPQLGKTLVIANPTAHSGKGKEGAEFIDRFLKSYESATTGYELRLTRCPEDATSIAREAASFDSVIALGGDGVIHEVVCGLMEIDEDARPALGIIPLGSGNDYARTLGMSLNKPFDAIQELMRASKRRVEIGRISNGSQVSYFVQTLSFGLDAAIAIDTTRRRFEGTKTEGEQLFMTSGLKIFTSSKGGWPCRASFDGQAPIELKNIIFAVQIGPTYGGGFQICPDANPTDGLLSTCYNVLTPRLPVMLSIFGLTKLGKHTHCKTLAFKEAKHIELTFPQEAAPCQVDGEEFTGTHFEIDVVPDALEVYVGPTIAW